MQHSKTRRRQCHRKGARALCPDLVREQGQLRDLSVDERGRKRLQTLWANQVFAEKQSRQPRGSKACSKCAQTAVAEFVLVEPKVAYVRRGTQSSRKSRRVT
eukprot:Amastigsp_a522863_9.p4 type:complete len:102 gc:universal Amastigsp_a522863_9:498-803(+)